MTRTTNPLRAYVAAWCRAAALSAMMVPALLCAEVAPRQFDIPAQPLSRALILFSQQSDIAVLAAAELVAGKQAPVVSGVMEPDVAMQILLRDSGLAFDRAADGSMRITRAPRRGPAVQPVSNAADAPADDLLEIQEIVVVGSHIRGPNVAGTLPVTVRTAEDLAAVGAVTTDQLIAALPQAGGQAFNSEQQGPNQARGDVASVNLRGLGSGNTLVLLNGRRMVLHPTTQQEDGVPVQIVNVNAIPASAIERLEVLRDGAGAIYGADATAGVLNHVIDLDYEGLELGVRYGFSEGTELDDAGVDFKGGWSFNEGATRLGVFASAFTRNAMLATDRDYSRSNNRSALVPAQYAGNFNDTSTTSPWLRGTVGTAVTGFGPAFTQFHLQPCSFSGSDAATGTSGVCIDGGSTTLDAALRADEAPLTTMTPESDRFSVMATLSHELDSGLEVFGEALYYRADSSAERGGSSNLGSAPLTISAGNPYNPFGSGPGRLPGYAGPAQAINVVGLRVFDVGSRRIEVDSSVYRALAGLRGPLGDWHWEAAALYSGADVEDVEKNRISNTALAAALSSSDPARAYNPFDGGDPASPSIGDATSNPAAVTDPLRIDVTRDSSSTLALADFTVSSPAAFMLFGNDVGAALGAEWRRESYEDDRDPRVDGTINYVTPRGELTSDVMNTSPTPDSEGSRSVASAYVELKVPLIAPEREIPLVRRIETQLAARYERFSDIDEAVVKPKISLGWELTEWLQLRGTWSEGFRAPNLEQVNATEIRRVEERQVDLYRCAIAQGVTTIAAINQGACSAYRSDVEDVRRGGRNLVPEDSETNSFGFVLQPLPQLALTVDWWRIEQSGLVGVFSVIDHLNLDAVRRLEGGSSNPNLERNAAGEAVRINNEFLNLDARTIRGVDVSVVYDLPRMRIGQMRVALDLSRLQRFDQTPSSRSAELLAAGLSASAGGSLIERDDNPRTRASASVSWSREQLGASLFARYVGEVVDSSALDYPVDDWLIFGASASYTFAGAMLDGTTMRLGVNNLLDEEPPLADEPFGYYPSLHDNRGRYFYVQLGKSFY